MKGKLFTKETFIEAARKIHGDKYDYSLIDYKNQRINIKIICPIHGVFEQSPTNHLVGCGCPKCAKETTKDKFIKKAKVIHGDKYNYDKINYKDYRTPIIVTCKEHGDFKIKPTKHISGFGCPKCEKNKNIKFKNDIFKAKLIKLFGDKYTYDKVNYVNCKTPVIITCKKHGDFEITPNNIYKVSEDICPYCIGENLIDKQKVKKKNTKQIKKSIAISNSKNISNIINSTNIQILNVGYNDIDNYLNLNNISINNLSKNKKYKIIINIEEQIQ